MHGAGQAQHWSQPPGEPRRPAADSVRIDACRAACPQRSVRWQEEGAPARVVDAHCSALLGPPLQCTSLRASGPGIAVLPGGWCTLGRTETVPAYPPHAVRDLPSAVPPLPRPFLRSPHHVSGPSTPSPPGPPQRSPDPQTLASSHHSHFCTASPASPFHRRRWLCFPRPQGTRPHPSRFPTFRHPGTSSSTLHFACHIDPPFSPFFRRQAQCGINDRSPEQNPHRCHMSGHVEDIWQPVTRPSAAAASRHAGSTAVCAVSWRQSPLCR